MTKINLVDVKNLETMARMPLTKMDVDKDHIERFINNGMNFDKDLQLKGKFCFHPFNTVTIDNKGECFVCTCQAWLPISVGNILQFQSLDEVVQSPRAREIQASIIDGTYKYCDNKTCSLLTSKQLEGRIDHRPDTVNWIVFAIDDSCNLSCPSCRTGMIFHNKGPEFTYRMKISEHLVRLINKHDQFLKFTLSGDGDPFASHVYRNLLENLQLRDKATEIEIVTNGIMVRDHWHKMEGVHNNVIRFKISFDAGTPDVYAVTRRGGDWNKLLQGAEHIIKWKQKNYSTMEIVANFVVQNGNYKDIHNFVKLTQDMGFDEISLQKVTDWGKWYDNGINKFYEHAVWMSTHENYPELVDILNAPLMADRRINLNNLSPLRKIAPKLSDLVLFKNEINTKLSTGRFRNVIEIYHKDREKITEIPVSHGNQISRLVTNLNQLISPLERIDEILADINQQIDSEIVDITKGWMDRGYKINGSFATNRANAVSERTYRNLNLSAQSKKHILAAIERNADWRFAGLEIGPGDGIWTEFLVACEPLYVVDIHLEFLENTKKMFNEKYQNKLRCYLTTETDLSMLPQEQMGFVFSINVFNYFPKNLFKTYLEEIFKVLRPGGVFFFSYNNAELFNAAKFAELGYMSYMPKHLLKEVVEQIGFEIIDTADYDDISLATIKKPGVLSSIKVHPTMGEIKK